MLKKSIQQQNNSLDWWKITGVIMVLTAFEVMIDNLLMMDVFGALFEGGILFALGVFLQKKSMKAFYILWFLTFIGFAAMIAGYDTPTAISSSIAFVLNLASLGSLIMLTLSKKG